MVEIRTNAINRNYIHSFGIFLMMADFVCEQDLDFALREIGIDPHIYREELRTAGFRTVNELRQSWLQLHEGTVRGIHRVQQKNLCDFASWCMYFEDANDGKEPDVMNDFNCGQFMDFIRSPDCTRTTNLLLQRYKAPSAFESTGSALYSRYVDAGAEVKCFTKRAHRATFLSFVATKVEESMSRNLKDACTTLNVKVPDIIDMMLGRLVPPNNHSPHEPLVIAGKTQSGKSAFKAVVLMVCAVLRIPSILITKEVSESKNLHGKLLNYMSDTDGAKEMLLSPYTSSEADITAAFNSVKKSGSTLVVPDTFRKIELATRVIKRYQDACKDAKKNFSFVLILDEADAMYRTFDQTQKMEIALRELQDFKPVVQLFVSATPVPILLYKEEFKQDLEMYSLEASHDYVGFHQMKCLKDDDGAPVFLDRLSHHLGIKTVGQLTTHSDSECVTLFDDDEEKQFDAFGGSHIPNTDDKVIRLYNHALSAAESGAKGVLVLDCTLSRVNVDLNQFQKAARVQDYYRSQGKDVFVIVNVGGGGFYRSPGEKNGKKCSSQRKVSEIIAKVDSVHGLETPIFIFGYSKMKRCISYRSAARVPTHIVLFMGQGHSIENLVQAVGRATFTGKEILKSNGHKSVTYLLESQDAAVFEKHVAYVQEIQHRLDRGETLDEAMRGSRQKLPDHTNYLRHTDRKTGQRAKLYDIGKYHHRDSFAAPADEPDEVGNALKEKYWTKLIEQRIMHLLCESTEADSQKHSYATADIVDAYNDQRFDSNSLMMNLAGKTLRALRKDALVRFSVDGGKYYWQLNHPTKFFRKQFLNHSLVKTMRQKRRAKEKRKEVDHAMRDKKRKQGDRTKALSVEETSQCKRAATQP